MSKVFIYYSASGNGDAVASIMKERGFDVIKLETVKPFGKANFFKMMKYGGRALKETYEPLQPYVFAEGAYEQIVLGSPVWAGRISTPLASFLRDHPLQNAAPIVLLYSASGSAPKAKKQLLKKMPKAIVYDLLNPKTHLDEARKLLDSIL
jgi:hypothetical protein